jgi:hypothetical protein
VFYILFFPEKLSLPQNILLGSKYAVSCSNLLDRKSDIDGTLERLFSIFKVVFLSKIKILKNKIKY